MGTSHTQVVCVWYTCTGTAGQTSQVQWSFETSSGYTPFDPHMSATIEAVCYYFAWGGNDCLSFYDPVQCSANNDNTVRQHHDISKRNERTNLSKPPVNPLVYTRQAFVATNQLGQYDVPNSCHRILFSSMERINLNNNGKYPLTFDTVDARAESLN